MLTLNQNKQKLWYASKNVEVEDDDGEIKTIYGKPVEFYGSISMSGGEAEAAEYGLNLGDYQAVLLTSKNTAPLTETSRIWQNREPTEGDDEYTADYRVVKISKSLNYDKYLLKRIVK